MRKVLVSLEYHRTLTRLTTSHTLNQKMPVECPGLVYFRSHWYSDQDNISLVMDPPTWSSGYIKELFS